MRKVRKVLLISPPSTRLLGEDAPRPPLGLCYLGAVLEREGYQVIIYNGNFVKKGAGIPLSERAARKASRQGAYLQALQDGQHPVWKEVESVVVRQAPDLVGVSVLTVAYGSALNVSRIVKSLDPQIPVVWGGPHPTVLPEECLRNPEVDIVVRGEGEETFLDLVAYLDKLEQVPGITFKKNGHLVANLARPFITDLDTIPFPAKHLVLGMEDIPPEALGHILATRGCPYQCIFCDSHIVWSRRVRYRSVENILEEFQYLKKTFGVPLLSFEDDSFTLNQKLVYRFCDVIISQKLNYQWRCMTRVDLITEELVQKMKQAGCEGVYLGLESGNEESLRRINKGITREQMKRAAQILHRAGVRFDAFLMMGFPWETREAIDDTLSLIKELDPFTASLSVATPHPGTELFRMCQEEGIIPEKIDWNTFFHQATERFFSTRFSQEEARQAIGNAMGMAEGHRIAKMRRLILSHPVAAIQKLIRGKYYYPSRLWSAVRYLTNI